MSLIILAGCGKSPPADLDESNRYAVSLSYLLEHRRHFFPGQAESLCFAAEGWSVESILGEFRSYHLPIGRCGEDGFLSGSLPHGLLTSFGPIRNGNEVHPPDTLLPLPYRTASVEVVYKDSRDRAATFSCWLFGEGGKWRVERCDVKEARGPESTQEIPRCWTLDWELYANPSPYEPPTVVIFTDHPDSNAFRPNAKRVTGPRGGSVEGWSWSRVDRMVELNTNGAFEGIATQLVWDPEEGSLHGVGEHWVDVILTPALPDPTWMVSGQAMSCGSTG